MADWRRDMLWPDTGLPWVPTSPNIPDVETALLYPGVAFFEGVAASEGRGTDTPFRLVGAPWLDGAALADTLNARALPGVRFEPARFTPRSIPGVAAHPTFEGEETVGVHIVITDLRSVRPVALGVHLLHAAHRQRPPGTEFFNADWLAKLAGTRRLQQMLEAGAAPEQIIASWQEEVAAFERARQAYLLYE
jgi:uncharacterized protein YbbC (DUF1343 family)